jgi:hypothetical protein
MFVNGSGQNEQSLERTFHRCLIHVYDCILSLKKNLVLCGKGDNSNLNIDTMNWITDTYASKTPQPKELKLGRKHLWKVLYKVCLFCPVQFIVSIFKLELSPFPHKKIFFRKHATINMNCLWRPCLLMDRDKISQKLLCQNEPKVGGSSYRLWKVPY